jgi:fibronectin type III domain protein
MKAVHRVTSLSILALALIARPALAQSVTLAWEPSADADLAGYIVQYGERPTVYSRKVDAGRRATVKLDGLEPGTVYYFAVQAYAVDGAIGRLSKEIKVTVRAAAVTGEGSKSVAPFRAARLQAPVAGQRRITSAQVFEWEAVPEAEAYYLTIGTEPGRRDVADSGEAQRTWSRVRSLPAGQHLYASVWTKHDGSWTSTETEFESAPKSVLVYPYHTASDASARETFEWTRVTDAKAYNLHVGTTPGGKDIADSGELTGNSFQVEGLQPDQTLYAEVYTLVKDVWEVDSTTFSTSLSARFTRPLAGDGSDLGQGLAWTGILGAEAYSVQLGSAPGLKDLLDTGEVDTNRVNTPALPAGTPLYATVSTKHGGEWRSRHTEVTLAGAALVSPAGNDTGTATIGAKREVFTWTSISNAQGYALHIGREPGAKDVLDTGQIQGTSYTAADLPAGTRLYVSVWTMVDGAWNGTASTFTTR